MGPKKKKIIIIKDDRHRYDLHFNVGIDAKSSREEVIGKEDIKAFVCSITLEWKMNHFLGDTPNSIQITRGRRPTWQT